MPCNFIKKETLAQVFSFEFYEISRNNFSYRTPLVAGSTAHALGFEEVMLDQSKRITVRDMSSG